jgi:hypothetical protein
VSSVGARSASCSPPPCHGRDALGARPPAAGEPRRARRGLAGVPRESILAGVVIAGAGFPLGVYLEERRRLGPHAAAWHATREALPAMGLSIVIELSATVLAAGAWLAAVLV